MEALAILCRAWVFQFPSFRKCIYLKHPHRFTSISQHVVICCSDFYFWLIKNPFSLLLGAKVMSDLSCSTGKYDYDCENYVYSQQTLPNTLELKSRHFDRISCLKLEYLFAGKQEGGIGEQDPAVLCGHEAG